MKRLKFVLPDETRVQWASAEARSMWSPRFDRIQQAWGKVERMSVVAGVRDGAIVISSPEDLPALTLWALDNDLVAVPMNRTDASGLYSAGTMEPKDGRPWVYRVLLAQQSKVLEIPSVDAALADDEMIGRLLGYPKCCRDFFDEFWVRGQWVDTTWPMAEGSATFDGPVECNTLLRWLGLRLVPHLPCSFGCEVTLEFAKWLELVWVDGGFEQELAWLTEALGWPMEWSSLHGVAEIRTAVVKVTTRSDAFPTEVVVRREGVKAAKLEGEPGGEWEWQANGFSSLTAMREAHRPVVSVARQATKGQSVIVDLGCGNGALLRRVVAGNEAITPWGVDLDRSRIEDARRRSPGGRWIVGDLRNGVELPEGAPVLLMPGRLLEAGLEERVRDRLLGKLKGRTVVAYAYEDWLKTAGSLRGLCEAAGLRWEPVGQVETGDRSAAVALRL